MFKKIFMVFVVCLMSLVFLSACGQKMTDGVYRAFKETVSSRGAPEVTTVSVTVKDGKIVGYEIDSIQSHTDAEAKTGYVFNEKSKKELGFLYGMHFRTSGIEGDLTDEAVMNQYKAWLEENDKLEWFEQAELIEKYWLENGVKDPGTEGKFDYITGVTISDNDYVTVAKQAVTFAKEGKTQVITVNGSDLIWVTAKVDKNGKFTELVVDTRQGTKDNEGKFVWNEKTKQELGYLYGMHFRTSEIEGDLTDSAVMDQYKAWLEENDKLEWFEQVNVFAEYVLKNGLTGFEIDQKIVKDDNTPEVLTAVTVTAVHYYNVFTQLYKDFK
ncbi:MAG: hypothetical protein M0R05_06280 [Bacilli bacterium]|nr:hypothetical protein [Bacilli bacterium]MDD4077239.1 hypothetical protein [Bacilli bacterium]MDD4388955.1 hypothetical protein [Bacilli bacterium]